MSDPATPSRQPRNRPRNGRSGHGRSAKAADAVLNLDGSGSSSEQPGDDDNELMALLGIIPATTPQPTAVAESAPEPRVIEAQPGVLAVSKEDRQRSEALRNDTGVNGRAEGSPRPGQKKMRGQQSRQKELAQGEESGAGSASEGDTAQVSRGKRKNKAKAARGQVDDEVWDGYAGLTGYEAIPLPGGKSLYARNGGLDDVSGLSQSLPAEGVFAGGGLGRGKGSMKRQNGKAQRTDIPGSEWDMPAEVGPEATRELTWQQQLASYPNLESTPAKRSGKAAVAKKGFAPDGHDAAAHTPSHKGKKKQANQLPTHQPLPQRPGQSSVPEPRPQQARRRSLDAIPPHLKSSQTETTPFHTGFNVHRAPQTPMRLNGGKKGNNPKAQYPIIPGHFPRIPHYSLGEGHKSLLELDQPFYAAPSIHNSPHQRDLPKPDISDF